MATNHTCDDCGNRIEKPVAVQGDSDIGFKAGVSGVHLLIPTCPEGSAVVKFRYIDCCFGCLKKRGEAESRGK